MHLRALELVGSVKTEASMESEKASFGGPDWQEPAGVPKCFMGEPEQRVVRSVLKWSEAVKRGKNAATQIVIQKTQLGVAGQARPEIYDALVLVQSNRPSISLGGQLQDLKFR